MTVTDIVFNPMLPIWLTGILAAFAIMLVLYAAARRARGYGWRLLFLGAAILLLLNPQIIQEDREPLENIVVLLYDESASAKISGRDSTLAAELSRIQEKLAQFGGLQVESIPFGSAGERGSMMFHALRAKQAELDSTRISGYLVLTDGLVHDVPEIEAELSRSGLVEGAPLHVLLAGQPDETDRKLVIKQIPGFGMVGEPLELVLRADDFPNTGANAQLTVRQDGQTVVSRSIRTGEDVSIPVTLDKAGRTAIEVEVDALKGELTTLNNRQALFINGIRDRLRVLLVSGRPYPGLRVWRNLLKADPAVDLVHFTILRPPEKQDGTPIRELALIAFPSRELFEVKLKEFDLVIFDRYERRGLLPLVYLDNVARYVEQGGALLDAAGPEFAGPSSLYRTPLARILPGRPSGEVYEQGFSPALTAKGERHPVTAEMFDGQTSGEPEVWGRWFRQVDVEAGESQVLLTGMSDRPLLLLNRAGEGRVAQLLSDHAWLWARGFENGGPQADLLRRLIHWLMKEPELEEESLQGFSRDGKLVIERRSLLESSETAVSVTSPSGEAFELRLQEWRPGVLRAEIEDVEDGLYRLNSGSLTAYASPKRIDALEISELRATAERLEPLAAASGGTVTWLNQDGSPQIRLVNAGRSAAGRGWIGLVDQKSFQKTGIEFTPVLPIWLAFFILIGSAAAAWWREGDGLMAAKAP